MYLYFLYGQQCMLCSTGIVTSISTLKNIPIAQSYILPMAEEPRAAHIQKISVFLRQLFMNYFIVDWEWDEQTAESWETCWCWLKQPVLAHFLTSGADPEGFPPGELARSHSHHSFCNRSTLELFRCHRFAHLVLLNLWLSLPH